MLLTGAALRSFGSSSLVPDDLPVASVLMKSPVRKRRSRGDADGDASPRRITDGSPHHPGEVGIHIIPGRLFTSSGRWVFTSSRGGGSHHPGEVGIHIIPLGIHIIPGRWYSHHPSLGVPRMFWRARVDRSPPSSSPSRLPPRVRRATSLLVRGHRRHDVLRPVESTTSFAARVAPSEPELRPSPPRARARAQSHASSRRPAPRPEFATRPSRQPPSRRKTSRAGRKRPRKPEPDTRIHLGRSTGAARGCTSRDPMCTSRDLFADPPRECRC